MARTIQILLQSYYYQRHVCFRMITLSLCVFFILSANYSRSCISSVESPLHVVISSLLVYQSFVRFGKFWTANPVLNNLIAIKFHKVKKPKNSHLSFPHLIFMPLLPICMPPKFSLEKGLYVIVFFSYLSFI